MIPLRTNAGCFGGRYRLRCFLGLLLFEMLLAFVLPGDILSQVAWLNALVEAVQSFVASIAAFDNPDFPRNEATRLYMLVALLLMPWKIYLFWDWMTDQSSGVYKHLVISPTTDTQPADGGDFITDPVHQEQGVERPTKPRSMFSRVFWSGLLLLLTLGCWVLVFDGYWPELIEDGSLAGRNFRTLATGWWFGSWYSWSIAQLSFTAFMTASAMLALRGYWRYFTTRFSH